MAKELKKRYPGQDYTAPGYYFITIKTRDRKMLFGEVVGRSNCPLDGEARLVGNSTLPPTEGCPRMEYTPFGIEVVKAILDMPQIGVSAGLFRIDCFQVMPDHIHILFRIMEQLPHHLGMMITSFYTGCRDAFRELYNIPYDTKERGMTTALPYEGGDSYDPWGVCSARNGFAIRLFEEGYNDWAVIKRGQLDAYFKYIKDNCRRYILRKEYPNLFKKIWGKEILPGMRFNMLGNMFLLDKPEKLQVRISRFAVDAKCLVNGLEPLKPTYLLPKREKTEEEIQVAVRAYLGYARKGAVLVTPAISPGEKAIVKAAYEEGLFVIRLLLRGMSEVHKPDGASIDACAKGLLLELAPWEYDPTRKYTKETCEALNAIAGKIAGRKE